MYKKIPVSTSFLELMLQIKLLFLMIATLMYIRRGGMLYVVLFHFLWFLPFVCFGEEMYLQNIRQLTFSEMDFEKAGEAYFSPDGASIIFQAVPKGQNDYQIYSMHLDEGSPRLVSTGNGACTCAFYHPNGKKIIFASSHSDPGPVRKKEAYTGYKWELTPYMNIYEADPDGSNLKVLTSGSAYHAECSYSSDGQKIVYASNESGSMNLYVMQADGSNPVQLTYTTEAYNGGPFFSPDGSKIVFRADRNRRNFLNIYLLDLQCGDEQQLTDNDAVNWAPYWHPDGDKIVFTTSLHGHSRYEIYLLDLKSGAFERITDNPGFDGLPVFSGDGKKLMWTSKRSSDKTCQIFIADFINPFEK